MHHRRTSRGSCAGDRPHCSNETKPIPATGWIPGAMTAAQCLCLSNLDMEAVEQANVQLIADYAELWLANRARNNRRAWTGHVAGRDRL
jgi:hypothetical protein